MADARETVERLTHDTIAEFKEAFDLMDQDEDGVLTKGELATVMRTLGFVPSDDELVRMMNEADIDENGTIEFKEFLSLMVRTPEQCLDPRWKSASGSTQIYNGSLVGSFGSVTAGAEYSPEKVAESLESIFVVEDADGSGWVDEEVFVQTMTQRGDAMSEDEMKELLECGVLPRKDGKVHYSQFIRMLTTDVPQRSAASV